MDKSVDDVRKLMEDQWEHLSTHEKRPKAVGDLAEFLANARIKAAGGR
jgi:hypothetical protein